MPIGSRHYKFISPWEIEATVIKEHGHMIICPPSFRDDYVLIRIFFKDRCDFLTDRYVKTYKNRTFILMPPIYESKKVHVINTRIKYEIEQYNINKVKTMLSNDKLYCKLGESS